MGRLLIGAFAAAILVFVWGYVSHAVLPIKNDAYRQLPDEDAVIGVLRGTVSEAGMYVYPGIDMSSTPTEEEEAAFQAKYDAGPRGLIVFDTKGGKFMSPTQLGTEFASNVLAALIAAFVLSKSTTGFFGRILVATLMGAFAWVSISVSQWNWDGFTNAFTLMEAIDQIGGWFLGGIALAVVARPRHASRP